MLLGEVSVGLDPLQAAVGVDPLQAAVGLDPLQAAVGLDPLQAAAPASKGVEAVRWTGLAALAFEVGSSDCERLAC